MMFSRRSFLASSAATTTMLGAGCKAAKVPALNKISQIGIQTYTLRVVFEQDPMVTLKMIKDVGYDYVELNSRNFSQMPAEKLKDMLDEVGLPSPAAHISLDAINEDLTPLMKTAKTLGLKYLTVPWVNEELRTLDHWRSHARLINEAGQRLRNNGFKLAYHNHQFEFINLDGGTTAMDILLNETAPENLSFQLDMFWAYLADVDIPALFKQHSGRFKLCHIKDMTPNKADYKDADYAEITSNIMVDVGQGVIPFEGYFALNDISGLEYFITEHDSPTAPYKNAITTSYNAVKDMRF